MFRLLLTLALAFTALHAVAQTRMELGPEGEWVEHAPPADDSDAAIIARARRALAAELPEEAKAILDPWIKLHGPTPNPYVAQAYLLRGDARTAMGREDKALYDYEAVIRNFPGSPEFVTALERELDIGLRYLGGLRRRVFGIRLDSGKTVGEELLVRISERLPASSLAERAQIELADYYYRSQDLRSASDMYEIFLRNFPKSEYRQKAMQRRIYSYVARYKGPQYDATGLVEADALARQYRDQYPADAEAVGINDDLLSKIDEAAASNLLASARWYLRQGDEPSARLTLNRLLRAHPRTDAAARALEIASERAWPDTRPAGSHRTPSPVPEESTPADEVEPEAPDQTPDPTPGPTPKPNAAEPKP